MVNKIITRLFLIGLILIGLNITGFFVPLRNPDIYQEPNTPFKDDITLAEKQLYEIIEKKEDESNEKYVVRLNEAINKGIAHYWDDSGINEYSLRIPIYENYLLFFASYIAPPPYSKYEYCNYRKAIERGVGLCSQHAIIISAILEEKNIGSKIIELPILSRHVVAMAQVNKENNTWWVLDPDYGVVIKHDILEIEKNPQIIREYYTEKGYDAKTVNKLIKTYGQEGSLIRDGVKDYCGRIKYYIEYLSYIGIWVITMIFLSPYIFV